MYIRPMYKLFVSLFVLALFVVQSGSVALAKEEVTDDSVRNASDDATTRSMEKKPKAENRVKASEMTEAQKMEMEAKREALKAEFEAKREAAKKELEEKKKSFEDRVTKIRDENKQDIARRLRDQLQRLNERFTKHFIEVLEKLDAVVARIEERRARAEARGVVTTEVTTALETAKSKLAAARTAVTAQAGKVYDITFDATQPKTAFKAVQEQLRADLKVVREIVFAARDAVHDAAVALGKVANTGGGNATSTPIATSTATTTP